MEHKKGETGAPMVTHRLKKPGKIACDCSRCKHSNSMHGFLYCTYYDIIGPKRTSCARYWAVKPQKKTKKAGKKRPTAAEK